MVCYIILSLTKAIRLKLARPTFLSRQQWKVSRVEDYLCIENTQCHKRDNTRNDKFSQIVVVKYVSVVHSQVCGLDRHNLFDGCHRRIRGLIVPVIINQKVACLGFDHVFSTTSVGNALRGAGQLHGSLALFSKQ